MSKDEIISLIESTLQTEPNTLTEQTELSNVTQWDSLSILNLQIELTVAYPDTDFDALRDCLTVGDIIGLCQR